MTYRGQRPEVGHSSPKGVSTPLRNSIRWRFPGGFRRKPPTGVTRPRSSRPSENRPPTHPHGLELNVRAMSSFASATSTHPLVLAFAASPPRPGDEVAEVAIAERAPAPFPAAAAAEWWQDAGADAGAEQGALLVSAEHVDEAADSYPATAPIEFDEALLAAIAARKAQDDAAQAAQAQEFAQAAPASPGGLLGGQWRKRKAARLPTPWAPKKQLARKLRLVSPLGGLRVLWESSDDDEPTRVASPVLGGKKIEWSGSDEE